MPYGHMTVVLMQFARHSISCSPSSSADKHSCTLVSSTTEIYLWSTIVSKHEVMVLLPRIAVALERYQYICNKSLELAKLQQAHDHR